MSQGLSNSLEEFRELARGLVTDSSNPRRLDAAVLLLAALFCDDVDSAECLGSLDSLADEAAPAISRADSNEAIALALLHFLSVRVGFKGNFENYYDPRNSFLHEVLARRVGIPISLAVVYVEVARRIDLPVDGMNFPGHFLIRYGSAEPIWIDPFHGRRMSIQECRERFSATISNEVPFEPEAFGAASVLEILVRMTSNLKQIYLRRGDVALALISCDALVQLRPEDPKEVRDRGLLYEQLGRVALARIDFEHFLALVPDTVSSSVIRARLEGLTGKSERLN